jgi:hypothetical protein
MGAACQRDCARVNDLWCSGSAVFSADCRTGGEGGACVVTWRAIWQCVIAPGVLRRSLAAAVIVGTVLNLINQGDALFAGKALDWLKVVLTYIVPYCVATYGAVAFRLDAMRRDVRALD